MERWIWPRWWIRGRKHREGRGSRARAVLIRSTCMEAVSWWTKLSVNLSSRIVLRCSSRWRSRELIGLWRMRIKPWTYWDKIRRSHHRIFRMQTISSWTGSTTDTDRSTLVGILWRRMSIDIIDYFTSFFIIQRFKGSSERWELMLKKFMETFYIDQWVKISVFFFRFLN